MISYFGWSRLLGVGALGMVIFASLMLPTAVEQMRTGHWFLEHFLGYSAALCLGWRRPFWVAGILTVAAFVLEGLQALTPNHSANLLSVLGGASGAWLAALIVEAIRVASNRRRSASG